MATRWTMLYDAALHEADPRRMPDLCELARRAMQDRLIELAAGSHAPSKEKETLQESLRYLFLLEQKSRFPN